MTTNKQTIIGLHAVSALLEKHPERVIRLCAEKVRNDKRMNALLDLAKSQNIRVEFLSRSEIEGLAASSHHQGVVALCVQPSVYEESDLPAFLSALTTPPFLLILDGVQDPHNLGACFRSADAAGIHAIIAPKDKSVGLTQTVAKVASGAVETVPFFQVTNLARTMQMLKESGVWLYGAAAEGQASIYQTDLKGPLAIVLGAEGKGLRRLTKEHCDGLVKIPMYGSVESLNVSVATGIFLFEAVRQRNSKIAKV